MSRINTNISSMIAQRVLNQNNNALNTSLERLSTGLAINRGKDNPAGLIASQNLRAEISAVGAAVKNAERADQVVNIAEGGLSEISSMLTELQALVTTTANTGGLSTEEREANQLQIDSILQTIDRIAAATSFQGTKLLNGNFDYTVSNVAGAVDSFKVNGAKLEFNGTRDVEVVVTGSARVGGFLLSFGSANINLGGPNEADGANEQFVIEITGAKGSRELSFASGTNVSDMINAINSFSDVTGVEAALSGASGIRLTSVERSGSDFVSVRVIDDGDIDGAAGIYGLSSGTVDIADTGSVTAFSAAGNKLTSKGSDVQATINGIVATTRGTVARINTDFLDVQIDLKYDTSTTSAANLGALTAFKITGGGADFQLAGRVDIAGRVGVGISNVAVRELGRSNVDVILDSGTATNAKTSQTFNLNDLRAGASLNVVDGNMDAAQSVVERAIREVSSLRGRLGSFQQNTIGATVRSLGVSIENTAAAESVIRDTDFATETASLTRSQVLASSAQQALSLANFQPQNALQLLG